MPVPHPYLPAENDPLPLSSYEADCELPGSLTGAKALPPSHGIAIAECSQKWLLPPSEDFPSLAICRHCGIVRRDRNENRKLARTSLEALVGKGRIVCGDNFGSECVGTSTLDDLPDSETRGLLREFAPCRERVADWAFTGRQSGIRRDDARKSLWMLCCDAQSDHSSPVLAHQSYPTKIELLNESGGPVYVPFIGVVFAFQGLVRASEAD